jgi:hypothetical protein
VNGRAARWAPWVVLFGFVALYGWWGATHLGGSYWDTDEGLNLMKARMLQLGHPLYTSIWSDQPPGLTVLLAAAFHVLGTTVAVARGVVLAHALVALVAVALLARACGAGPPGALVAAIALALAPNFFWASRAVMIGLPAVALSTLGLALVLLWHKRRQQRWLVLAGLVLGLSLVVKLIGAYLVVPFAVAIVGGSRRRSGDGGQVSTIGHPSGHDSAASRGSRVREVAVNLGLFAVAAALPLAVALLAFDGRAMLAQVVGSVTGARAAYALDVSWNADKVWFWLAGDHLALVGPALFGAIVLARRRSVAGAVVLTWLGLTLAALLLQTPLWPKHHFLALLVILTVLAGVGIDDVVRRLGAWRREGLPATGRARFAVVAGLAAVALGVVGLPALVRGDAMRVTAAPYKESGNLPDSDAWRYVDDAVRLVQTHTAPGDFIVTDHGFVAFRSGRSVPPELCVVSGKRIALGDLTAAELIAITERYRPAAVLLWEGDRLSRIPEYAEWVRAHYRKVGTVADLWWLYVPGDGR